MCGRDKNALFKIRCEDLKTCEENSLMALQHLAITLLLMLMEQHVLYNLLEKQYFLKTFISKYVWQVAAFRDYPLLI